MDSINSKPTKPKSARRPAEFRESLAPAMPFAPNLVDQPGQSDQSGESFATGAATPARTDWLRYGLYLVWALAAVTAGIGAGLLLIGNRAAITVEPPVPIATATLTVTSATAAAGQPQLVAGQPLQHQSLGRAAATDIRQAQAGSPFAVASTTNVQPAAGTQSALQPGFDPAGLPQGNLGTASVR